jgi:hypothetical protein
MVERRLFWALLLSAVLATAACMAYLAERDGALIATSFGLPMLAMVAIAVRAARYLFREGFR